MLTAFSYIRQVIKPKSKHLKPLIVDACLLFNEIDLLEIRLGELWDVVDLFVVIESNLTFAGQAKPYFFEQHRARFDRFSDKLRYFKHHHAPHAGISGIAGRSGENRFLQEAAQRDAVGSAIAELGLGDEDIVVLCDVDEIPRPALLPTLPGRLSRKSFSLFLLRNIRGYVNSLSRRSLNGTTFVGPVACSWATMKRTGAHRVRTGQQRSGHVLEQRSGRWDYVEDAGWHVSSTGGAEAFWVKAQNFSHIRDPNRVVDVPTEIQPLRVFDGALSRQDCAAIQARYLASGGDPAFSPLDFDEFNIEQDIPRYLRENKQRFRRFFFFTHIK